ncbi:MAG TPA: tetratricopeptide repeat protein, partial [Candidatus Methylomirabilis sp.]|nr:tetratricopeptide repeat protein [Candidatus Methylomirabilis sp.]
MQRNTAQAHFARGEEQRASGRFTEALHSYREAAERLRRRGDEPGLLACRLAQGHCLRLLGRFAQARARYQDALALAIRLHTPTDRADADVGLGMSLRALGDTTGALRFFARAGRTYH